MRKSSGITATGKLTERIGIRVTEMERIHCERGGNASEYIRILIARDIAKEHDKDMKLKIKEVISEMVSSGLIKIVEDTKKDEINPKEDEIVETKKEDKSNSTKNLLNSIMNM